MFLGSLESPHKVLPLSLTFDSHVTVAGRNYLVPTILFISASEEHDLLSRFQQRIVLHKHRAVSVRVVSAVLTDGHGAADPPFHVLGDLHREPGAPERSCGAPPREPDPLLDKAHEDVVGEAHEVGVVGGGERMFNDNPVLTLSGSGVVLDCRWPGSGGTGAGARSRITDVAVDDPEFELFVKFMRDNPNVWSKVSCPERLSVSGPPALDGERSAYRDVVPFARRIVETFPDRVDDPTVGLMRDHTLDLTDLEFASAQRLLGRGHHLARCARGHGGRTRPGRSPPA